MSEEWRKHEDAVCGSLLCLGGMLFEWRLPLDKAINGLRAAYQREAEKQVKACTCPTERDRELCMDREHCAEVRSFAARNVAADGTASEQNTREGLKRG
jgi:hypothetical protein